jgi:hypothetical protein
VRIGRVSRPMPECNLNKLSPVVQRHSS